MYKHDDEDRCDAVEKRLEVACKDDYYHCDEYYDRHSLKRLVQLLSYAWVIVCAEHSKNERNTHDDHDASEDLPEWDFQVWQFADVVLSCIAQIHFSPERKVYRGGEDAGSCIECCQ